MVNIKKVTIVYDDGTELVVAHKDITNKSSIDIKVITDGIKENKVYTIKEARAKGWVVHEYPNGDYKYINNNDVQHLIGPDGIQKCEGKDIFNYKNGDYGYIDNNGKKHYIEVIDGEKYEKAK